MDGIQLRNLNQQRRHGRHAARDKLQIADRSEECCTPAARVDPTFALLEAQRSEQVTELRESLLRGDLRHGCKSLDHPSIVSLARADPGSIWGALNPVSCCDVRVQPGFVRHTVSEDAPG